MLRSRPPLRYHFPLLLTAFAVGCASDGTSPDPSGRSLGILQMIGAGAPAPTGTGSVGAADAGALAESPGATSVTTSESSISWDVPPGEGTLFPPEVLQAPSAAIVGFPFSIRIFTVGPNGCWSPDGIDVAIGSRLVDLGPWDRHSGADACTLIFGYMAHDTIVTLSEPGQWTLSVEGRRIRGDGSMDGSVRAERSILAYPHTDVPAPVQIQLAPGQEIVVDGVLPVRFVAVEGDSRCPADVQCVWQGDAAVRIAYSSGGAAEESVLLHTGIGSAAANAGGYRIRLVALAPHPLSTMGILATAYRATLQIDRLLTP